MSSEKTAMGLHKWVGTDAPKREEFNENFGKIESSLNDMTKYNNQADFVEIIKSFSKFNRVRFRKTDANKYEVSVDNGKKHVTYGFVKDPNDDFIKLGKGSVGDINGGDLLMSESYAENLTGTWSTSSPPFYYTTQVGATFSANATGDKIIFRHRSNNQGGIWEFVVDGNTANKVTISTWAEVDPVVAVETVIFTGLANTSHTVVGTFKGDDPLHVPSGGAGTSRGWVWCKTTDPLHKTMRGYIANGNITYTQLLAEYSNKEIVFNLKYANVNQWIPEHDAKPVVFNKVSPMFLMDDVEINVGTLALYEWVVGTNFKLIQNNYIRTPESGATNLAEWSITHSIGIDGVVNYAGFAKALQNIRLNIIYALMLPVIYSNVNETLTSIGNSKVSTNDGIDYYYPNENDQLLSGCFINSSKPNYIAAGSIVYPLKTMRIGKIAKPVNPLRFWQRTDEPKLYFQSAENWDLIPNDIYTWAGKIAIGNIENIYNYVKG